MTEIQIPDYWNPRWVAHCNTFVVNVSKIAAFVPLKGGGYRFLFNVPLEKAVVGNFQKERTDTRCGTYVSAPWGEKIRKLYIEYLDSLEDCNS